MTSRLPCHGRMRTPLYIAAGPASSKRAVDKLERSSAPILCGRIIPSRTLRRRGGLFSILPREDSASDGPACSQLHLPAGCAELRIGKLLLKMVYRSGYSGHRAPGYVRFQSSIPQLHESPVARSRSHFRGGRHKLYGILFEVSPSPQLLAATHSRYSCALFLRPVPRAGDSSRSLWASRKVLSASSIWLR